jgi:adenylate cyclase
MIAAMEHRGAEAQAVTGDDSTADDGYLGDGITDELAARLSRLRGLHVIARASTVTALERSNDTAEIGSALGADTLLRGTVGRTGDDVHLMLEVVDVATGTASAVAAQRVAFERLEAALRTLAWEVAGELALQVYGEERRQLARQRTDSAAAYTLYLKGRYFWNKRDRASMQSESNSSASR